MKVAVSTATVMCILVMTPVATAQEGSVDTEIEAAACAVMDEVTERMLAHLDMEDRWIEAHSPGADASSEAIAQFNQRVAARNGVYDMALRFIDDYNTQCSTNVELRVQARMCARRPDRMRAYLHDGETCRRNRASRSN